MRHISKVLSGAAALLLLTGCATSLQSPETISGIGTRVALGEPLHDQPLSDAGQVRVFSYQEASSQSVTQGAGLPGIYLHIAGPVGRAVADSPVYYRAYRAR